MSDRTENPMISHFTSYQCLIQSSSYDH